METLSKIYSKEKRCGHSVAFNTYKHLLQNWIYSFHKQLWSSYYIEDTVQVLRGMSEMYSLLTRILEFNTEMSYV